MGSWAAVDCGLLRLAVPQEVGSGPGVCQPRVVGGTGGQQAGSEEIKVRLLRIHSQYAVFIVAFYIDKIFSQTATTETVNMTVLLFQLHSRA